METIAKIRAEIERRKGQLIRGACAAQIVMETNCKDEAYNEVLSFLDTLEEEPVDVSRDENIGLSIMFFLGTHVKHENSVLVRGKGEVTYKEACEWIRRNIAREKSEKPMNLDLEIEIEDYVEQMWQFAEDLNAAVPIYLYDMTLNELKDLARHFAQWGAEHLKK